MFRGGSTRVFSGGHIDIERCTPHVKISPTLNHPPLAEEVRHLARNAVSACPFSPSRHKRGTLSQHFVTHVVPPLHLWPLVIKTVQTSPKKWGGGGSTAKVDIHCYYGMPIILSNDSLFHFINTTHTIAYTQ